jgi:hypothetical protein
MPYTTTAGLCYPGPKIPGCGTLWDAAIRRWANQTRHSDVTFVRKTAKIGRGLPFIKWANSTMRWGRNTS